MATFSTLNYHGYDVKFSPFEAHVLTVAASENFGFSGGGALFVLKVAPTDEIQLLTLKKWLNGLFCTGWCKPGLILSGSSDGSVQIWNLSQPEADDSFVAHKQEISSIECVEHLVLTSSWDRTLKLYDLHAQACVNQFLGHQDIIFEATLSRNLILSASGDRTLKIWDCRSALCVTSIQVHDSEVLSCDWCKLDPNIVATSASDSLIRVWDLRRLRQPLFQLKSGARAVKKVRFSPHFLHVLGSSSFDGTSRIWDVRHQTQNQNDSETLPKHPDALEVFLNHSDSEFVYGLDWSGFELGLLGDCGWDSVVKVFESDGVKMLRNKM